MAFCVVPTKGFSLGIWRLFPRPAWYELLSLTVLLCVETLVGAGELEIAFPRWFGGMRMPRDTVECYVRYRAPSRRWSRRDTVCYRAPSRRWDVTLLNVLFATELRHGDETRHCWMFCYRAPSRRWDATLSNVRYRSPSRREHFLILEISPGHIRWTNSQNFLQVCNE